MSLHDSMDCSLPGASVHGDPPGKNSGEGCHLVLQKKKRKKEKGEKGPSVFSSTICLLY